MTTITTKELDEKFPSWSVHFPTLYEFVRSRVAEARLVGMKARGHCPSCTMKNAHPFAGGPCRGPQED